MSWNYKDMCKSQAEAVEALADLVTDSRYYIEDEMDKAKEFASKWGIPFDPNLIKKIKDRMPEDPDDNWTSSSAHC